MSNVKRGKSTRKFPKGRWEVRWRTPEGAHRTKTFDLRDDADRFAKRVDTRIADGEYIDKTASAVPYRDLAARFLDTVAHRHARTRASYRAILNDRLLPAFGEEPVSKITPSVVRSYLAEMKAHGRKAQTIRNVFFILQASLDIAVEDGCLKSNPCRGINKKRDLPKAAGTSFRAEFLDASEVAALAAAIEPPYSTLVLFASYTGLRAGELYALLRSDVDLRAREVAVFKSRATTGPPNISTTKTGDERTVPFPRFLAQVLAAYLEASFRPADAPLFDFPNGYSHWYTHTFKPAARSISRPQLRFHDLRHTAASLMIASGASPTAVASRLGHKTVSMTLNRYAKHFRSQDDSINDGLEAAFRAAQ